jgi:hypothetical protein
MAKPFFWLPLSTYHSSGLTEGVSSISKADKVCWNLSSFHLSKSCPMWSFHACSAAKTSQAKFNRWNVTPLLLPMCPHMTSTNLSCSDSSQKNGSEPW